MSRMKCEEHNEIYDRGDHCPECNKEIAGFYKPVDTGHAWFAREDFKKATSDLEASRARVKELEELRDKYRKITTQQTLKINIAIGYFSEIENMYPDESGAKLMQNIARRASEKILK